MAPSMAPSLFKDKVLGEMLAERGGLARGGGCEGGQEGLARRGGYEEGGDYVAGTKWWGLSGGD